MQQLQPHPSRCERCANLRECNSQVVSKTHAAIQDAHNAENVRADAVDDDVRTWRVGQMRRGQVAPSMAELRVLADRLERVVDLVAVGR